MQALTKFDLVINLKTAKALGVTTSSSLRCAWSLLADSVAKVENRSAPKISRKSIFGRRYLCKTLHGGCEDP
jgi:hypothetical protein